MDNQNIREIVGGFHLGFDAGKNLEPGMAFLGAYGHAELAGINPATERLRWKGFLQGFLDGIKFRFPNGVITDTNGVITG